MYLKIMISRIMIHSRSTMTYIHSALSELDQPMAKCGNDVTKFNYFVRMQLDALKARGKSSNDIMVNHLQVINPYLMGSSSSIWHKINHYDDGSSLTEWVASSNRRPEGGIGYESTSRLDEERVPQQKI